MEQKNKYDFRDLAEGDIVDFEKNNPQYRFGIVTGGFGMSTACIGSKIFGVFGATVEQVKANYKDWLKIDAAETQRREAEKKATGGYNIDFGADPDYKGYTRRQPCMVIGRVDLKTGEDVIVTN